jgi:hypothetical protein
MKNFITVLAFLLLSVSAYAIDLSSCCGNVQEFETNSVGYSVTVNDVSGPVCTIGFSDKEIEKKATPIFWQV